LPYLFEFISPYPQIFGGEWIKFTGVDAYYHMRLVDNLVHNFPHLINFDPYSLYPIGLRPFGEGGINYFDWFLAGIIWVIGLGSPTPHTIDVVGAYFPAILGALTVIPVYFIGKELFGRWAGILAAGLIAVMSGEFMGRSILSFTDHHVAETLLTATAMMFLVLAIKTARERGLTFNHLRHRDWEILRRPVIYSLLAGVFLAVYLLTWIGALLFVFIISVYFFIQLIIDHLKRQSSDYLVLVGVIFFLTPLIIQVLSIALMKYALFSRNVPSLVALLIAVLIPVVLAWALQRIQDKKIKTQVYYLVAFTGAAIAGLFLFKFVSPSAFQAMFGNFNIFAWGNPTIIEMRPFLFPAGFPGDFTLDIALGSFSSGFFISLIALGFLVHHIIKHGSADKTLLLVWSVIILLATLGQRRFAYYLSVNIALLTSYALWEQFKPAGKNFSTERFFKLALPVIMIIFLFLYSNFNPAVVALTVILLAGYIFWQVWQLIKRGAFSLVFKYVNLALAVLISFLIFYPNLQSSLVIASTAQFAPSDAWLSSLTWLKENSPEPFGDPDFYYQRYEPLPPEESYPYPESAYAVMAWVDYGYWITRIAHRPVNVTPGPGGAYVAKFFLSQDEDSTQEIEWRTKWEQEIIPESEIIQKLGSDYIIIDHLTVINKFWALVQWAELDRSQFYDSYLLPQEERKFVMIQLYYPEYYRSMVVRLYNFDGQAVTPESSIVIAYEERLTQEGQPFKLITEVKEFLSYEEATAYIASRESGNYRIVNDNPFVSPVPLAALKDYRLIHSSDESAKPTDEGRPPPVKIFEYLK